MLYIDTEKRPNLKDILRKLFYFLYLFLIFLF